MKTIGIDGPYLYSVSTKKSPGKIRVRLVRFEEYEYENSEFDSQQFRILDSNRDEVKELIRIAQS